jgi:hypothetical protein
MPTAPAASALSAFSLKVQVPRSTSTIFPATSLTMLWQPRVGSAEPSSTSTRLAVRSKAGGPKFAVATAVAGPPGVDSSTLFVTALQRNISMTGEEPSSKVKIRALLVPRKSWACATSGSLPSPPRPKLSVWALPAPSLKPESYQ